MLFITLNEFLETFQIKNKEPQKRNKQQEPLKEYNFKSEPHPNLKTNSVQKLNKAKTKVIEIFLWPKQLILIFMIFHMLIVKKLSENILILQHKSN